MFDISLHYWLRDELDRICGLDDKESFVELCHQYPDDVVESDVLLHCTYHKAKNCLIALVSGEACVPPPALPGCATCIHEVVVHFPDLDVVNILLARGATSDLNINYEMHTHLGGTPLYLLLQCFSDTTEYQRILRMHLGSWSPDDSVVKLIILFLCTSEVKNILDIAQKFACYTDSVNDIAWCFLENGKLLQLTALLLAAHKKVMAPFETGMTIQQRLTNKIDELSSKVHFDNEHAEFKSLLMDASKLFDVFERIGDDLSTYCTSINKHVTPEKVVVDVMGLVRKAGIVLQAVDIDLRDCYRGHLGVWKANLFKLSDCDNNNNKLPLHLYPTEFSGLGTALDTFPSCHWDPLIGKLKSREVVKLAATPRPRLMSTLAGPSSSIPVKHLAYVAMKLKRGIRF